MALAPRIGAFLASTNQRITEHAHRHRVGYVLVAGSVFCAGLIASSIALNLDWRSLEVHWLLLNLLLGAPIAIGLNTLGLKLSATVVGASLSLSAAFRTCCIALCSNLLPIPAGSIVQASSLASRGGSMLQSGFIVVLGNGISLALIATLVGAVITGGKPVIGLSILGLGVTGLVGCAFLLSRKTSTRILLGFLSIRLLRTLTIVLRIQLSFLIIGVAVSILDAAVFSGAVILGTVVAVFPAGLGASETIAALLALATTIAPGAAFVATALNRLATLAFAGIFLLFTKPIFPENKTS